ncbi:hypothetical protein [Flavobacterium beibuense]|nr:hypothetical protein [Flavobacterium beibuense]
MRKKVKLYIAGFVILLIITDRYIWMPNRTKETWLYESGTYLGDPIANNQDFEITGSTVIFKQNPQKPADANLNRKNSFYFSGCYFGRLFLYDKTNEELVVYSRKRI